MICQDSRGVGRYSDVGSATTFYYSDVSLSDVLGRKEDVTVTKHVLRGVSTATTNSDASHFKIYYHFFQEPFATKSHGSAQNLPPVFGVLSTNECFFTHRHEGVVVVATKIEKRGVDKASTAHRDFEAHDKAVR